MARSAGATVSKQKRTNLRNEHWASEPRWWDGAGEKGWFTAPRSLPYVLLALDSKAVAGESRISRAYVDLLSRHIGEGVVELEHEDDHAFAAGYGNARTWRDRMGRLESAGFIKTASQGYRKYARAFIVHPTLAMQALRDRGKLSDDRLWNAYRSFQIHAREPLAEKLLEQMAPEISDETKE